MARYKPVDPHLSKLLPVRFSEQILPGTFEYALNWRVDHEIDLSVFDTRYRNDEAGASAYHPGGLLTPQSPPTPFHAQKPTQGGCTVEAVCLGAQPTKAARQGAMKHLAKTESVGYRPTRPVTTAEAGHTMESSDDRNSIKQRGVRVDCRFRAF